MSGDLTLFAGTHPHHARQRLVTGSRWSHVGIVVQNDASSGETCLLESTMIPTCPDIRTGELEHGVQLSPLFKRLDSFQGDVAIRKMNPELSQQKIQLLAGFIEQTHGLPFNLNKWVGVRSRHRRNRMSTGTSFFCSELVAAALQYIGVISLPPLGRFASNFIPSDFASDNALADLPLVDPYKFEKEVVLKII